MAIAANINVNKKKLKKQNGFYNSSYHTKTHEMMYMCLIRR